MMTMIFHGGFEITSQVSCPITSFKKKKKLEKKKIKKSLWAAEKDHKD